MAALRELEIEIPTRQLAVSGAAMRGLVPIIDAIALLAAAAVSTAPSGFIAVELLIFVILNADTSRGYRLDPRVGQDMGWLLQSMAVPLLVLATMASVGMLPWSLGTSQVEPLVVGGSIAVALVIVGRLVSYSILRASKARGLVSERALIAGSGPLGITLAQTFGRYPEYGLSPVGFIDGPTGTELPYPLLGGLHQLERVVRECEVRRLVVAFGSSNDRELAMLLRQVEALPLEVHVVPPFFELGLVPHGTEDHVRGIPLIHLRHLAFRRSARALKRVFDVVVASTLLVLLSPLFLVAAVGVKLSSKGPVLFRQVRLGRLGESFQMLKFRTMRDEEDPRPSWGIESHRVTKFGRWLRRTSLDEVPQLINVIRGDMSLVGPRPELPQFVERFSATVPGYADRLRVQGGITGLAQVHGRSRELDEIPERIRLDNAYIESRSLWGDIRIMFRTLEVIFLGDRS